MKINLTYIISNTNKALQFEWVALHLNKNLFNLHFILLNPGDSAFETFLKQHHFPVTRVTYTGKRDILPALFSVYKTLKKYKSTIVHTHLVDASLIGLTAAWLAGIKKRITTRHHCDFHHQYYPQAVKYDRYVNTVATHIISISDVVHTVLTENEFVKKEKIHTIHHGFLLDAFLNVSNQQKEQMQSKYGTKGRYPLIGVISRYIEWKGIQYIIPAFGKLLHEYPDALLILTDVGGSYKKEITELLKKIPSKNYLEISFEPDVYVLYQLFDLFVHAPVAKNQEAFGQTYVEALAAGVPSVFTLAGIACEFIEDRHNALVVPYENQEAIYQAMLTLLNDKILSAKLIAEGKKDVISKFSLNNMITGLEQLYTT